MSLRAHLPQVHERMRWPLGSRLRARRFPHPVLTSLYLRCPQEIEFSEDLLNHERQRKDGLAATTPPSYSGVVHRLGSQMRTGRDCLRRLYDDRGMAKCPTATRARRRRAQIPVIGYPDSCRTAWTRQEIPEAKAAVTFTCRFHDPFLLESQ